MKKKSSHSARRLKWPTFTGLLGVLLRAKKAGHLQSIRPLMDDLREKAGLFIGEGLYSQAGRRTGILND
ncbi:MAG: DUF3368 domain-containing protein [Bacteroidetes bacterium]|nr:DUF3368 domain-containing protein [Bacteroidota bacterium]